MRLARSLRMRRRKQPIEESTAQLTPNRGGDLVEGDISLRDELPDSASYQSNHAITGMGGDDDRGDADDAKVKGQSRG
jgi:hypothetical protein